MSRKNSAASSATLAHLSIVSKFFPCYLYSAAFFDKPVSAVLTSADFEEATSMTIARMTSKSETPNAAASVSASALAQHSVSSTP